MRYNVYLTKCFDLNGSDKWLQTIYCVLWSCSQTVGTGRVQYPPNVQQTNDPFIYPWSNQALDSRDGQEIRTTAVKTRQQASHGSQVCICLYNYSTTLDSTADFWRVWVWIKKWETLRNIIAWMIIQRSTGICTTRTTFTWSMLYPINWTSCIQGNHSKTMQNDRRPLTDAKMHVEGDLRDDAAGLKRHCTVCWTQARQHLRRAKVVHSEHTKL